MILFIFRDDTDSVGLFLQNDTGISCVENDGNLIINTGNNGLRKTIVDDLLCVSVDNSTLSFSKIFIDTRVCRRCALDKIL